MLILTRTVTVLDRLVDFINGQDDSVACMFEAAALSR